MITNILFTICIFLSIMFGFVNIGSLIANDGVPQSNVWLMTIGFTGVITKLIGMW